MPEDTTSPILSTNEASAPDSSASQGLKVNETTIQQTPTSANDYSDSETESSICHACRLERKKPQLLYIPCRGHRNYCRRCLLRFISFRLRCPLCVVTVTSVVHGTDTLHISSSSDAFHIYRDIVPDTKPWYLDLWWSENTLHVDIDENYRISGFVGTESVAKKALALVWDFEIPEELELANREGSPTDAGDVFLASFMKRRGLEEDYDFDLATEYVLKVWLRCREVEYYLKKRAFKEEGKQALEEERSIKN